MQLARRIDDLDSKGRAISRDATGFEKKIREHIHAPFDLEEFLELQSEEDVESKLSEFTAKLNAVRKERELLSKSQLELIKLPDVPRGSIGLLQVSVESIVDGSAEKAIEHFRSHLGSGGESWVRQGLSYVKNDSCPFCGQNILGNELVESFRNHFSEEYRNHVVAIQRAINEVEHTLGEDEIARIKQGSAENDSRVDSWSDFVDLSYAKYSTDRLAKVVRHLRSTLLEVLKQKLSNPTEALEIGADVMAAISDYETEAEKLLGHNEKIELANEQIGDTKKQAASTDPAEIEAKLRRLRNIQIRHQPDVAELCSQLAQKRQEKKATDEEKDTAKKQLTEQATALLARYEEKINQILQVFGATFRIVDTKPSFAGGRASSNYKIAINEVPIDLGDASTQRGTPCFRTALSTGDKSTLALAFFIAKLQQDSDLNQKVVVFDDPLSSLDCFRTTCTQQEICRVAESAKQVIVMSHDAYFLRRIFDSSPGASTKTLCFSRAQGTYTLLEWDIREYCTREAYHDYFVLREFIDNGPPQSGDLQPIARCIRPYIEGHFRQKFPDEFPHGEWLGDFIGKVQQADASSALAGVQATLSELVDLNDYSKGFHHNDPAAPQATTNDTELRTYAERAIRYVREN